jgi:hypothetical protein
MGIDIVSPQGAGVEREGGIPRLTSGDLGVQTVDEAFVLHSAEPERWSVVEVYPEETIAGTNIRETNWEHARSLARSIFEQGQLQECVGETMENGTIRVWAGQHRRLAVLMLNDWLAEKGFSRRFLRVRVSPGRMSNDEVFAIQIAENLQHPMTSAEKAEAIGDLARYYADLYGQGDASTARFARMIGRKPDEVYDALRFISLDPRVRQLVHNGLLLYTSGVIISRLPMEKHLRMAVRVTELNLDREGLESHVRKELGSDLDPQLLITGKMAEDLDVQEYRLTLRDVYARNANDAAAFFERILYLRRVLSDQCEVNLTMTRTVAITMASLITSAERFRTWLTENEPWLLEQIDRAVLSGDSVLNLRFHPPDEQR